MGPVEAVDTGRALRQQCGPDCIQIGLKTSGLKRTLYLICFELIENLEVGWQELGASRVTCVIP